MLDNFIGSWIVYARILTLTFVKNFRLGFENRISKVSSWVQIERKREREEKITEPEQIYIIV